MKLYLTATSERGKPVEKSGNEAINIQLTKDRIQKFSIMFDGDKLEILNFSEGKIQTIEYIHTCNCDRSGYCQDKNCLHSFNRRGQE